VMGISRRGDDPGAVTVDGLGFWFKPSSGTGI